jgi:hypothetical protein
LLAKVIKNILRGVNFTNLKTPGGYIAKSKPQGVCLQLTLRLGGGKGMEWKNKNILSFPMFGSLSRREWNGMERPFPCLEV